MVDFENPLQDLIELNNRYERIENKSKLIDISSDEIENRKKIVFEKSNVLENNGKQIPLEVYSFVTILLEKIEERKKMKDDWKNLCKKRVILDDYTNSLEKSIFKNGYTKLNNKEIQTIELLVTQFESISIKQENLLNKRIQVQEEEDSALLAIEKILSHL